MSAILEKLAKIKAAKLSDPGKILREFSQVKDIDFLDLLPCSKSEDELFCIEGSLLQHYCSVRLKERGAETALKAIFATQKDLFCYKCSRIYSACLCKRDMFFHLSFGV